MTPEEAETAITTTFASEWISSYLVAYDNNDGFAKPEPTGTAAWLRLAVIYASGTQNTLGGVGNRLFRKFGSVVVQVFTVAGTGTLLNQQLASQALNIFEGRQIDSLWFLNGAIETIGTDGVWYQQNVNLEIQFDQIK